MEKRYLQLSDIDCYRRALALSNYVWSIVIQWKWFEKQTVGVQFVTAIDSISANIAEGFGRYSKRDRCKFYYYSLGSLKEVGDWNEKSKVRILLKDSEYEHILKELQILPKELYHLINYTNEKLNY